MIIIVIAVLILFMIFTLWILMSWFSIKSIGSENIESNASGLMISVLIPIRNEGLNIESTLKSILKNKMPSTMYEVIVIDDHSDDNTRDVVEQIVRKFSHVQLILLNDGLLGKKKAIETGISIAKGEIILCTDGDCKVPIHWLQSYYEAYFKEVNSKLIFGGVKYENHGSYFINLLNVELSILVMIGAATMNRGMPTMINGANLSYKRETFIAVNGFKGNENIPSGDDEFLLRKVKKQHSSGIGFLKNPKSIVETAPPKSIMELINQRRRWGSKWKHHHEAYSKLIPILVFSINASAIWAFFQLLTTSNVLVCFAFLTFKGILDFLFMRTATNFIGVKGSLLSFILLEIIYPLYVVFFAFASNFGRYSWKGRVYEK